MAKILTHPYLQSLLTKLRDKNTKYSVFRDIVRDSGRYIAYEISRELDFKKVTVETPLGIAEGLVFCSDIVLIMILRASLPLVDGMMEIFKHARVGVVSAKRIEEKKENNTIFNVVIPYERIPDVDGKTVIIADPMLATATTMIEILKRVKERGKPKKLIIATLIASEYGVNRIERLHPDAQIYTLAIDKELNENGYIIPGLGDAGDRAFGTS